MNIPVNEKYALTIKEAAAYFNIGIGNGLMGAQLRLGVFFWMDNT